MSLALVIVNHHHPDTDRLTPDDVTRQQRNIVDLLSLVKRKQKSPEVSHVQRNFATKGTTPIKYSGPVFTGQEKSTATERRKKPVAKKKRPFDRRRQHRKRTSSSSETEDDSDSASFLSSDDSLSARDTMEDIEMIESVSEPSSSEDERISEPPLTKSFSTPLPSTTSSSLTPTASDTTSGVPTTGHSRSKRHQIVLAANFSMASSAGTTRDVSGITKKEEVKVLLLLCLGCKVPLRVFELEGGREGREEEGLEATIQGCSQGLTTTCT